MREKMIMAYLMGKAMVENAVKGLVSEEKGASDMVAVVLLIVIIIGVAWMFRTTLEEVVGGVMTQLSDFVG